MSTAYYNNYEYAVDEFLDKVYLDSLSGNRS